MKKICTFTFAASALALALPAHAQSSDTLPTRFGMLAVVSDPGQSKISLNGKPLAHPNTADFGVIDDASSLAFGQKFVLGDADVVLVRENSGGAGCPMTYSFVTVSAKGASITRPVADDHCSDIYKVSRSGSKIVLKIGRKTFTYAGGTIR